jgi:hypothetical protein
MPTIGKSNFGENKSSRVQAGPHHPKKKKMVVPSIQRGMQGTKYPIMYQGIRYWYYQV